MKTNVCLIERVFPSSNLSHYYCPSQVWGITINCLVFSMKPVENQCRHFIVSTMLHSDHTCCMMPWQTKSFTGDIDFHQNFLNYCFSCSSPSPVKVVCRHLKTVFLLCQPWGWSCSFVFSCRTKGSSRQKAGNRKLFWKYNLNQGLLALILVPRRTSRAKLYLSLWQIIACKIPEYCYVFFFICKESWFLTAF